MGKKFIHINRNVIQSNAKNNTRHPVCRIQDDLGVRYSMRVKILGPSEMIYDPDHPLKCGAKLWIETDAEVELIDETV